MESALMREIVSPSESRCLHPETHKTERRVRDEASSREAESGDDGASCLRVQYAASEGPTGGANDDACMLQMTWFTLMCG